MRRYRIAVIPGDGIGKEVIAAGIEVLKAVADREGGIEWSFDTFDWGSDYLSRDRPHDAGRWPRANQRP